MEFRELITQIADASLQLQKRALQIIDQLLVLRNWLIGFYIIEYEQLGIDRASYGDKLLEAIASDCKKQKIKGLSITNLKLCRQFYQTYPAIGQPVADFLKIGQPVADQFSILSIKKIVDQDSILNNSNGIQFVRPEILLQNFSFRHFTELIKIGDSLRRLFYEQQAIKGNWSARELKRQIDYRLLQAECERARR